jgi:ribonuclease P protein component
VKRFGYRPAMRLRLPAEYERVYAAQQKRGDRYLLIFAAANGLDESRCGISVSRRHGKAVQRTRLKRLLREAFRLSQHDLPKGFDFVVIPRHDSGAGLKDYRDSLERLAWKLARLIRATQSQEASRET